MASTSAKRKHVTLTIAQKCEILDKIKDGVSMSKLAQQYNVGRSTVFDIKCKEDEIRSFVERTENGTGDRKTLKTSDNPILEDALFAWYVEQTRENVHLTSEMLIKKAKFFHERMGGAGFSASTGWLRNFKKRYGVSRLNDKVTGEKLSHDEETEKPFQDKLMDIIRGKDLTADQIYYADEAGLYWKAMPNKMQAFSSEGSVPEEKITFMACVNVSGTHKLPLLVVGNASSEFASINKLPVHYIAQRNASLTRPIFLEWLRGNFIPEANNFLWKKNLPMKGMLLLDNAPEYFIEEALQTIDENFTVLNMPPDCKDLIQAMDQNVIQNIKVNYKKKLLLHVFGQQKADSELTAAAVLKKMSLKDAVFSLAQCWKQISSSLITQSWKALWPHLLIEDCHADEDFETEDDLPISVFQHKGYSEADINKFLKSDDIFEPAEPMDDDEILRQDTEAIQNEYEEDTKASQPIASVSHSQAVSAFNTCIEWADQVHISVPEQMLLRKLRDRALRMTLNTSEQL